jgi:actin-like ATPase involved in cell morphogenesis
MQKGMMLSGGTAQYAPSNVYCRSYRRPRLVADHPQLCVAKGTGIALENLEAYKTHLFQPNTS